MSPRQVKRQPPESIEPKYEPYYQRQQSPRGLGAAIYWKLALAAIILIGLLSLLHWAFMIKTINVADTVNTAATAQATQQIINRHFLWSNLLLLPADKLAAEINQAQGEQISEVRVAKHWFGRAITIKAADRGTAMYWRTNAQLYEVDQTGKIIKSAAQPGFAPLVIDTSNVAVNINDQVVGKQFINFVQAATKAISEQAHLGVSQSRIADTTNELLVDTKEGFYVRLDTNREVDEQVKQLQAVLADAKAKNVSLREYVDVRLAYKAYYK